MSIKRSLKTDFIGRKIYYYPVLPSTMDTAREMARQKTEEGTVIIAGEQTAGRGRLKRTWLSPPGNIALSIILYPGTAGLPYLTMIASLATAKAIEVVAGKKAEIKWPNDILIGGKKSGGILIENEIKKDRVEYSLIGMGININLEVKAYPEIAAIATSLDNNKGSDRRAEIIRALLTEFERLYINLPDGKSIYTAWREKLVTLGKRVRATSTAGIIEGIAESVDETGALMIREANGEIKRVIAGDVTLREK
jgi:BirA family biotin operon repressor/biotin-[acetyl-CoA-carboxylase] ligase